MDDIITYIDDRVQIIFTFKENSLVFRDALWYQKDVYESTPQSEIDAEKTARINAWLSALYYVPPEG